MTCLKSKPEIYVFVCVSLRSWNRELELGGWRMTRGRGRTRRRRKGERRVVSSEC